MRAVMKYCMRDDKTWDEFSQRYLVSGINCSGVDSIVEFEATKAAFQKMDGTNFYQYVQSFSPKENITPSQAHEIALEFAARAWPGTEVLVATHCDTDHVHSHFVLNSVSFETGLKLRQSPNTLKELRMVSDQVCMAHGLGVLKPYEGGGSKLSAREWRAAQKGESWKFQLMYHIGESMKKSRSKEDFVTLMERKGYKMIWTDTRAQITFICPNGKSAGETVCTTQNTRKEILNMNSKFENDTPNSTYLDKLIQANGQAVETREQVPYQPIVYAIPEEWRLAEKELLEQAVKFQPELYRQIRQLAIRQQVEIMREQQLAQLREISDQTMREVNRTLQQDGSVREQNFSRVSTMLSDSREEWQEMMDRFEIMLWKLLICTAVASVALSVLVCMVLRHWLG